MEDRGVLDALGIGGHRRRRRRRALVVLLAGVVVLIGWLVLVVRAEGPSETLSARGVQTPGVITSVSGQSAGGLPGAAVDVGYLYKGRYRDERVFLDDDSPSYRVGQAVTVTVDPLHPWDVTVGGSDNQSPASVWTLIGLMIVGLLLVIFGGAFLINESSVARRVLVRGRQRPSSSRMWG
jgi:Protein of unknown function (DUF3592)